MVCFSKILWIIIKGILGKWLGKKINFNIMLGFFFREKNYARNINDIWYSLKNKINN